MKMKLSRTVLLAGSVVGLISMTALGAGEKIKVIDVDAWGSGGGGGPFEVQPISFPTNPQGVGLYGAASGNFLTFCIETNETLSTNGEYFIDFANEARNGGSGGPSPDPLDDRTAYLYAHFIRGTLQSQFTAWAGDGGAGGTFTYGAFASGEALQRAIWYLEEESLGSNSGLAGALVSLAGWATSGGTGADVSEITKVKVMNMWDNANFTGARQDLLVMIPLPAPVWMGGIGLCGVVGLAVRRRVRHSTSRDVLG
jgi:hypothetical protein